MNNIKQQLKKLQSKTQKINIKTKVKQSELKLLFYIEQDIISNLEKRGNVNTSLADKDWIKKTRTKQNKIR